MSDRMGLVEQELEQAIAAGKAPQFEVKGFDFHNMLWQMGSSAERRQRVLLNILLDGQEIPVVSEQNVQRARSGLAYEGRLGSVDLMERALRDALLRRWPEIGPLLEEVKTTGYAVHALGDEQSHFVQVHLNVVCGEGKKSHPVSHEGVDTIGVTFDVLVTVYRWVAWRLLRRLRGEERKNKKN